MANVTSKTYGPGGRNIALEYEAGDPKITKDGVTVSKSVFFKDREQELGAKLLKRIADATNTFAGDGTTLSTCFSASLIEKACGMVDNGIHPIFLKKGMIKGKDAALEILKQFVIPVTSQKELLDVCMVSSNYNKEIANITSKAIDSIDRNAGGFGNLEIEPSRTGKTELVLTKGMFIQRGWVTEDFCHSSFGNSVELSVTLDYPMILVINNAITETEDIVRIMDMARENKRPLLVFSTDLQEAPLSAMVYNAQK